MSGRPGKYQHYAIDLDGTLLEYYPGMGEKGEFGEPYAWALAFVKSAVDGAHEVTVFTSRPAEQWKAIQKHLHRKGFPMLAVTNIKRPEFTVMIDDRAINFHGQIPRQECFEGFEPWWQKPELSIWKPSCACWKVGSCSSMTRCNARACTERVGK